MTMNTMRTSEQICRKSNIRTISDISGIEYFKRMHHPAGHVYIFAMIGYQCRTEYVDATIFYAKRIVNIFIGIGDIDGQIDVFTFTDYIPILCIFILEKMDHTW